MTCTVTYREHVDQCLYIHMRVSEELKLYLAKSKSAACMGYMSPFDTSRRYKLYLLEVSKDAVMRIE